MKKYWKVLVLLDAAEVEIPFPEVPCPALDRKALPEGASPASLVDGPVGDPEEEDVLADDPDDDLGEEDVPEDALVDVLEEDALEEEDVLGEELLEGENLGEILGEVLREKVEVAIRVEVLEMGVGLPWEASLEEHLEEGAGHRGKMEEVEVPFFVSCSHRLDLEFQNRPECLPFRKFHKLLSLYWVLHWVPW